ncbi:hypothetical protein [Flavicella sediminum]|uniref:hypothetical protein n=1 Tax=Flavicella sediminum TaxID=2585141 RepID=UPI00111DA9F9|nr:hypothetical protein [Flavicella sediminum]
MNTETRKERKKREAEEALIIQVETTWAKIKGTTVKLHGRKCKIRQIVRSKANELPKMELKDGSIINHYLNLKKAICVDGVKGFNNYIELVNKRINEIKQK